jgi:hypothetical protein
VARATSSQPNDRQWLAPQGLVCQKHVFDDEGPPSDGPIGPNRPHYLLVGVTFSWGGRGLIK